jgi:6-phosphofructokinase 1
MKIGIIASGGNSPAMNNAVIALVKYGQLNGIEVVLIKDGYKGVLAKEFVKPELA